MRKPSQLLKLNEKNKKSCTKVDMVFIKGTNFRGLLLTSSGATESNQ